MEIKFSKAIALNSDLTTAQAFVYPTANLNLAILISASGEDIFTKVRQVASESSEQFFTSSEPVTERLSKVDLFLKQNLEDAEVVKSLICAWQENVLYLNWEGNHKAYLFRDNQLINLTPPSQDNSQRQLISGFIKEGDRLLFLTDTLDSFLNLGFGDNYKSELEKLVSSQTDEFEDTINSLLSENQGMDAIAAVLINFPLPLSEVETSEQVSEIKDEGSGNLPQEATSLLGSKTDFSQSSNIAVPLPKFMFPAFFHKINLKLLVLIMILAISLGGIGYFAKQRFFSSSSAPETQNQTAILTTNPQSTTEISDWPLFLSLDLIKDDFSVSRMSESLGKLLLLDEQKKTLVLVDLTQKTNIILAGADQLGEAKYTSLNGDFAFVYSEDKGILRVDTKLQKASVVVKPDDNWAKIADIAGFAGNIYLLDPDNSQVWKYVPIVSGYSDASGYLKGEATINLAGSKKMLIDSSVWILKPNQIDKFTQGIEDSFSASGLDKPLEDISVFYVSDTTDNLYLIDAAQSRLVVLDKTGQLVWQYQGDKFATAKDLVVDEEEKKAYLLEGESIYIIDLK